MATRFRYRLQAALDRARALELEAAGAARRALGAQGSAREAMQQAAVSPLRVAPAAEFAWSSWVLEAARRRLLSSESAAQSAQFTLLERRRSCEAFSLHREQCRARFAALAERAAEADLEEVNLRGKHHPKPDF